jgi:uncharacterized protein (TIGR02588 family)
MNKNRLEWTVFAISVTLILIVAGLLVYEEVTSLNRPADLTIVVGEPVAMAQGYAVPLDVRNSGDTSAEDVHVSVIVGGTEAEESDVTFPYVPYRSTRRGWVMFSRSPGTARLEARVLGYREP